MQLNEIMKVTDYKIVEGDEENLCYPEGSRWLDFVSNSGAVSIYFNPTTEEVYDVHVFDSLGRNHNYRWVTEDFVAIHDKHFRDNNLNNSEVSYTSTEEDILNKVSAILNNRSFDKDVVITFELETDVLEILKKKALDQNITLDQLISNAIEQYAKEILRDEWINEI